MIGMQPCVISYEIFSLRLLLDGCQLYREFAFDLALFLVTRISPAVSSTLLTTREKESCFFFPISATSLYFSILYIKQEKRRPTTIPLCAGRDPKAKKARSCVCVCLDINLFYLATFIIQITKEEEEEDCNNLSTGKRQIYGRTRRTRKRIFAANTTRYFFFFFVRENSKSSCAMRINKRVFIFSSTAK